MHTSPVSFNEVVDAAGRQPKGAEAVLLKPFLRGASGLSGQVQGEQKVPQAVLLCKAEETRTWHISRSSEVVGSAVELGASQAWSNFKPPC